MTAVVALSRLQNGDNAVEHEDLEDDMPDFTLPDDEYEFIIAGLDE